jgi:hypothetical protein
MSLNKKSESHGLLVYIQTGGINLGYVLNHELFDCLHFLTYTQILMKYLIMIFYEPILQSSQLIQYLHEIQSYIQ